MLLAVAVKAGTAVASDDIFQGYPPWLVVLVGAIVAALVLWVFAKLLKWTIWILIVLVLVGGVVTAARMLLAS